jgi:hypothetical protein
MKKNYDEGIESLSYLIQKKSNPIREHLDICYACRAYGFAAKGEYSKALKDFKEIKK